MSKMYIPVPLHVKRIVLRFAKNMEPISLTGKGRAVARHVQVPTEQPPVGNTKHHYVVVLVSAGVADHELVHITHMLCDRATTIMVVWVLAQMQAGNSALSALRAFLEYCQVDDDEYSIESAYRQFMRCKPDS